MLLLKVPNGLKIVPEEEKSRENRLNPCVYCGLIKLL